VPVAPLKGRRGCIAARMGSAQKNGKLQFLDPWQLAAAQRLAPQSGAPQVDCLCMLGVLLEAGATAFPRN